MINSRKFFIVLSFVLFTLCAKADHIRGISVEAPRKEIVVLLNGQPMCEPTSSCFIANLHPGNYLIQVVFADEMRRPAAARRLLYSDNIRYTGRSVHRIRIPQRAFHDDCHYYPHEGVMDRAAFNDFCQTLRRQSFDDAKEKMIKTLHPGIRFSSRQCKDIVEIFSFDDSRVKVLKKLYPRVVDPENFYKAVDALSFSSNKEKVFDFMEKYNRKHY